MYNLLMTFLNGPEFICLYTVKWLYTWFVSQYFVGNLISKWVRANLFAQKYYGYLHMVKWFLIF